MANSLQKYAGIVQVLICNQVNTAKLSNIYGLIVYSFYVFSFNFSKTPRPIN